MKYLLDANTLIEAKNRYYGMSICPAFWDWLLLEHQTLNLASITSVKDELSKGNDELAKWTANNVGFFQAITDQSTQAAYIQIATYVAGQAHNMKVGALEEFLDGADPWLIARALSTGASVVTHEVLNLDTKRKFIIPNVCKHFGVSYMNTFELLHKLEARFVLPR